MSSKPHGGSVASAALLTIPPGAPLICANSWTRVAAIARVALGDSNSRDAIVISFLNVIPKRPGSVLGLKLTKTCGSLQTEAKSLPPGSLAKAPLQLFRMPLSQMTCC